jgi:hypothetical protein
MKTLVTALITALGLLLAAVSFAAAQRGNDSVNGWSAAQRAKAEAAVKAAGFIPGEVAFAQGDAVFIYGVKGPDKYLITVTPDGKVYPGAPWGKAATPGR